MRDYPPAIGSNALRKSDDPEGRFTTPLKAGLGDLWVDYGYERLDVRILKAPHLDDLQHIAAIGSVGHVGGGMDPVKLADEPLEDVLSREEFSDLGLQQMYEADSIVYLVSGCTRGFTHEQVRTRKGAWYLQQTFRHTDLTGTRVRMPEYLTNLPSSMQAPWITAQQISLDEYARLVEADVPFEDARTVLPLATETWIIAGMPWRTFVEQFEYRACYMFYPEMRWIHHELARQLNDIDSRLADMLQITCERSHVCEYRGAEPTSEACPFLWAGRRRWFPPEHAQRPDMKQDLPMAEWDRENVKLVGDIATGFRTREDYIA